MADKLTHELVYDIDDHVRQLTQYSVLIQESMENGEFSHLFQQQEIHFEEHLEIKIINLTGYLII